MSIKELSIWNAKPLTNDLDQNFIKAVEAELLSKAS